MKSTYTPKCGKTQLVVHDHRQDEQRKQEVKADELVSHSVDVGIVLTAKAERTGVPY